MRDEANHAVGSAVAVEALLEIRANHVATARERVQSGRSVILCGERGSGTATVLGAVARSLARTHTVVPLRPDLPLTDQLPSSPRVPGGPRPVLVIDATSTLPGALVEQILLLARSGGVTLLVRSADQPGVRETGAPGFLDLWTAGQADRVDLNPLTAAETDDFMRALPGAIRLDELSLAAIARLGSGSATLINELVETAVSDPGFDPTALIGLEPPAPPERIARLVRDRVAGLDDLHADALAVLSALTEMPVGRARYLLGAEVVATLERDGHVIRLVDGRITVRPDSAQSAQARLAPHAPGLRRRVVVSLLDQWESGAGVSDIEMFFVAAQLDEHGEEAIEKVVERYGTELASDIFERGAAKASAAGLPWRALGFARRLSELGDELGAAVENAVALSIIGRSKAAKEAALQVSFPTADRRRALERAVRITALMRRVSPLDAPDYARRIISELEHSPSETLFVESVKLEGLYAVPRWDADDEALLTNVELSMATRLRSLSMLALSASLRGDPDALDACHRALVDLVGRLREDDDLTDTETSAAEVDAVFSVIMGLIAAGTRIEDIGGLARDLQTAVLRRRDLAHLCTVAAANGYAAFARRDMRGAAIQFDAAIRRHHGGAPAWYAWLHAMRALASLRMGDTASARRMIDTALTSTSTGTWWSHGVDTVAYRVLFAEGRVEEAQQRALAMADELQGAHILRVTALFDAVQFGLDPSLVLAAVRDVAREADLPSVQAIADTIEAVVREDPDSLDDAARRLLDLRLIAAAEFAAANALHLKEARGDRRTGSTRALLTSLRRGLGSGSDTSSLTEREQEVAVLVAQGHTNREIATQLFLSVRTVESHVYQTLAKLGGTSRRQMSELLATRGIQTPARVVTDTTTTTSLRTPGGR